MTKARTHQRSFDREFTVFLVGLAIGTALVFTYFLVTFYIQGLNNAIEYPMKMEARAFEQEYRKNPDTPLPRTYTLKFYLGDSQQIPEYYRELIPFDAMEPNTFFDALIPSEEEQNIVRKLIFPKEEYLLTAFKYRLHDGKNLYVVSEHLGELLDSGEEKDFFDIMLKKILWIGGGYLLTVIFFIGFYIRRSHYHTQKLSVWATTLSLETLNRPLPDFCYRELNDIAQMLQSSFQKVASLLEREQQFLRHSSHELRTPIAVIRTNIELLECIGIDHTIKSPVERIRRANHNMQNLTETLLWISRETAATPTMKQVRSDKLVDEVIDELSYLMRGKDIEIRRNYWPDLGEQNLPVTPARIVLNNLLRNAIQYTFEGTVDIEVTPEHIVIENHDNGETYGDSDTSFGLGLLLVQKICDKIQWPINISQNKHGVRAELALSPITQTP
ncbi:sensor histidine kinase [Sansalvadorimonas verongulae]|uniref:sensor histidine kinase n=1 Tax=Sansalvadorimonas verongulae TaxID=2172824 RepID=UPI0012BB5A0D|nr:HAMP domain-containing sensor histidine kinase [Sansalvadorimonas verongulae]MTI13529.1 HAMP domain-containing histidine kinase [Sansalvadorimonas verongulae]